MVTQITRYGYHGVIFNEKSFYISWLIQCVFPVLSLGLLNFPHRIYHFVPIQHETNPK